MFKAVAAVFQQIMTELSGAGSEHRIVAITKTVLKLMKQNVCMQMTCIAD